MNGNNRYVPYVIVSIVCITLSLIGAGVILAYAGEARADAGVRAIGLMVGMLAPTITTLVLLVNTQKVQTSVERVEEQLNGHMDEKIRSNVHVALDERENGENS